jgi:hypothetical protein
MQYSMEETSKVADEGTEHITDYLKYFSQIVEVINVEKVEFYQEKDIDLLAIKIEDSKEKIIRIEIKVDRHHESPNFFFETTSNNLKETEGCFMYSEADLLFYYFINTHRLYILPMEKTRAWFIENQNRFEDGACKSEVGNGGTYGSLGKKVPRSIVVDEVEGVVVENLEDYIEFEVEYEQ